MPGNAGQLGHVQRPGAHRHELRGELVAAIRAHDPTGVAVIPLELGDLGVEQRVVVEAVLLADAATVLEDLGRVRVLLRRHVPGLFEQRHVDERRGVALRAGIAVPVPGTAEVAGLVDDADVVDPGFLDPRARHQAREPAADERERDVVAQRLALDDRHVRVVEVVTELVGQLDVLVVAVGSQPLVALGGVLLLEGVDVDRHPGSRLLTERSSYPRVARCVQGDAARTPPPCAAGTDLR